MMLQGLSHGLIAQKLSNVTALQHQLFEITWGEKTYFPNTVP